MTSLEGRRKKEEGRRKNEEGRTKKEERRRKNEEGRTKKGQKSGYRMNADPRAVLGKSRNRP
jgi:hypothetical protein